MIILTGWQNFYVIVGSSAGALIGLQFVVMTLVAGRRLDAHQAEAGDSFTTPTVVHFGAVLFLAAVISAPWRGVAGPACAWAAIGLAGCVYVSLINRRMRRQKFYRLDMEDRIFYTLLPLAAYASIAAAGCAAIRFSHASLFVVAAAVLLLLFAGIHNAWDIVTYHVFQCRGNPEDAAAAQD